MSGGVNVKSASRGPSSSGIPLPHSLLPTSPKPDPRRNTSSLPRPSTHTPKHTPTHTPKQTPTHTPTHTATYLQKPRTLLSSSSSSSSSSSASSSCSNIPDASSSRGLLRDVSLRNQLLQRAGALPVPQASRSACGSPQSPRREARDLPDQSKRTPHSAAPPPHTHTDPQGGNRNGNAPCTNQNQAWYASGHSPRLQFRRGHVSDTSAREGGEVRGQGCLEHRAPGPRPTTEPLAPPPAFGNVNLQPSRAHAAPSLGGSLRGRSGSSSQSDEEMWTPEDASPVSSPSTLVPSPNSTGSPDARETFSIQGPAPSNEAVFPETQTQRVNMATVAPFRYRLQVEQNDLSLDELSDCSSGSIDVCCDAFTLGGMLAANVASISMTAKPRELDLRSPANGQDAAARTMASRKIQSKPSALPQGLSRPSGPELRVYRPASGSIPIPSATPAKLRKQHSLTNLAVLTDAEKKMHLYPSPLWSDDMGRPGAGTPTGGQGKTAGPPGAAKGPLSRTLSKSEQSLFQGKPKPFLSPAGTPSIGKPSRIPAPGKPRGPYAEVKPISQGPEPSKGPDPSEPPNKPQSNGTGSTGINAKKPGEKGRAEAPSAEGKKEAKEVEGESPFLKVDPELVVTVLGDLEQLLFSQMLGG